MPVGTVVSRDDIQFDYCPAPVHEFTGRQNELEQLGQMFEDHQVIAVVGLGGVGKSQLARKYSELYKETYQYRFWIEADTIEKLDSSFKELAKILDVKISFSKHELLDDIFNAFTKGRALLIFDNVAKPEHVYEYLPTRFHLTDFTVNILITSIWTDWTTIKEESMVLQPFEAKVSFDLLQILAENGSVAADEKSWMELANIMGHLPLALRLSSKFIRNQQKYNAKFTIHDYILDFNTRIGKLLTKTTPDQRNNASIYVTTIMTLESLGKKSKKLINAVAYFNPEMIFNSDLVPIIPKASDLAEALADIINYSLFLNETTDRFTMHRLIKTSIQLYQQKKKKDEKYYSLTLEYAMKNPCSTQGDNVFAYADQYRRVIVQNYKRKQSHRPVLLKYLLRNRCTETLKIILEKFNSHIDKYESIYLALGSQCPDMFVFILSHVASPTHKQHLSDKLFKIVYEQGNKSIIQFLLENRLIPVTEPYNDKQTLLHYVASNGSAEIVSLILELNKEVMNIQDMCGNTALHIVIKLYSEIPQSLIRKTVRVLIDRGASVVLRDEAGCTPLHYATAYADVELVSLISHWDKTVVNIVENNGRTALHHLCIHYSIQPEDQLTRIASVLIQYGATVVTKDQDGRTSLHFAAGRALAQLVSLLILSNKKVIDVVDNRRNTALHLVARNYEGENSDCVEQTISVLIENGLSIHTRNSNSLTPMDTIPMKYKQLLRRVAYEYENSTRGCNGFI